MSFKILLILSCIIVFWIFKYCITSESSKLFCIICTCFKKYRQICIKKKYIYIFYIFFDVFFYSDRIWFAWYQGKTKITYLNIIKQSLIVGCFNMIYEFDLNRCLSRDTLQYTGHPYILLDWLKTKINLPRLKFMYRDKLLLPVGPPCCCC